MEGNVGVEAFEGEIPFQTVVVGKAQALTETGELVVVTDVVVERWTIEHEILKVVIHAVVGWNVFLVTMDGLVVVPFEAISVV